MKMCDEEKSEIKMKEKMMIEMMIGMALAKDKIREPLEAIYHVISSQHTTNPTILSSLGESWILDEWLSVFELQQQTPFPLIIGLLLHYPSSLSFPQRNGKEKIEEEMEMKD